MKSARNQTLVINGREIGAGRPMYCVAELSGNHNGSRRRAIDTVLAAARAGADAVKLQTYTADTLTIDSDKPDFVIPPGGPWGGRRLYELYQEASTPWDWHEELFRVAREEGVTMFSTPFDESAVRFLEELGAPCYKVASFELVDDVLLTAVARTGKPVIVSTGMASVGEIRHALDVLRAGGANELLVLHCTSAYPAPDDSMRLSNIPLLSQEVGAPVGLSDHSMGTVAPVVARTLGAVFVEKHVTLDRAAGGVDSEFSLEPQEFGEMVQAIRRAEAMLSQSGFDERSLEQGSRVFRRSLYVVRDVKAGQVVTAEDVRAIRPGYGLAPRYLGEIVGKKAIAAIERGTPVARHLFE